MTRVGRRSVRLVGNRFGWRRATAALLVCFFRHSSFVRDLERPSPRQTWEHWPGGCLDTRPSKLIGLVHDASTLKSRTSGSPNLLGLFCRDWMVLRSSVP